MSNQKEKERPMVEARSVGEILDDHFTFIARGNEVRAGHIKWLEVDVKELKARQDELEKRIGILESRGL